MYGTKRDFRCRNLAMTSSVAVAILGGLVAGCAGHQAGHGALARHPMPEHAIQPHTAARDRPERIKGGIAPGALTCTGNGPVVGAVGILRPGEASAAKKMLGKFLRAQATDSVSGQIMFFAPAGIRLNLKPVFSKVSLVSAQASAAKLHSCDMMLANLPAAQPVITAAENAVVKAHLAASLAALRKAVQEVLLNDNALRSGALVVTLQVTGAKRAPIYSGTPPTYSLVSLTVVMNYPSLTVTAVTSGGL